MRIFGLALKILQRSQLATLNSFIWLIGGNCNHASVVFGIRIKFMNYQVFKFISSFSVIKNMSRMRLLTKFRALVNFVPMQNYNCYRTVWVSQASAYTALRKKNNFEVKNLIQLWKVEANAAFKVLKPGNRSAKCVQSTAAQLWTFALRTDQNKSLN